MDVAGTRQPVARAEGDGVGEPGYEGRIDAGTGDAIRDYLSNAFPAWVKHTPLKHQSTSAFNYACVPMGGYPLQLEMPSHSA